MGKPQTWQQEILAEQVCLYRHHYDPSMHDHRHSQMANNSWQEIATTMVKEESISKKVWKILRDKFVKAKNRGPGKSGDPDGFRHSSPILSELCWLSQFVKHRETNTNMDDKVSEYLNSYHTAPCLLFFQLLGLWFKFPEYKICLQIYIENINCTETFIAMFLLQTIEKEINQTHYCYAWNSTLL